MTRQTLHVYTSARKKSGHSTFPSYLHVHDPFKM